MGGNTARSWIEEDEARDEFLHPETYLPFRLADAADAAGRLIDRVCRDRFDLMPSEWRSLAALTRSRRPEAAPGLIMRGLAFGNPYDGYEATPEGLVLAAELSALSLAYEAALVASMSPEEVKALHRLLGRLETSAHKLLGR